MVLAWASLVKRDFGRFRAVHGHHDPVRLRLPGDQVLRVLGQVPPRLLPATNTFLAIYFTLTGLHGLHVIGGMAVNA